MFIKKFVPSSIAVFLIAFSTLSFAESSTSLDASHLAPSTHLDSWLKTLAAPVL